MRNLLVAGAVFAALTVPALGEDRFAPGNPWFYEFEATCRDGDEGMIEECKGGVLGAFAAYAGTDAVTCDFAAFWAARDADRASDPNDMLSVLPWQYGVEALVERDGVCAVAE